MKNKIILLATFKWLFYSGFSILTEFNGHESQKKKKKQITTNHYSLQIINLLLFSPRL